jgi:hypothetical protein
LPKSFDLHGAIEKSAKALLNQRHRQLRLEKGTFKDGEERS